MTSPDNSPTAPILPSVYFDNIRNNQIGLNDGINPEVASDIGYQLPEDVIALQAVGVETNAQKIRRYLDESGGQAQPAEQAESITAGYTERKVDIDGRKFIVFKSPTGLESRPVEVGVDGQGQAEHSALAELVVKVQYQKAIEASLFN